MFITFSFLHFRRLWENEVGDPHFLCARSVVNILMYYWQFFGDLKDKRRRLRTHVSVHDIVPRTFKNVEDVVKKMGKSTSLNSPPFCLLNDVYIM